MQNHDNIRIGTLYGTKFIDSLNALTLFLPGVAIVYYGGEIGMEDIPDEINFARSPMQWKNTKYAGIYFHYTLFTTFICIYIHGSLR